MESMEIEPTSFQLRRSLRNIFLIGLKQVLESYTTGCLYLSDARLAVEAIQKDEEQDFYEDVIILGPLTPKEKIVCLGKVARMFLECSDMSDEKWYEMWMQATCCVIFQHGLKGALEMEADTGLGVKYRTAFCEIYNSWFACHIADNYIKSIEPTSKKSWEEKVDEFWDSLVESSAEPWADEDFMMLDDYYPNKSDEADFRRSLSYLLHITEKVDAEVSVVAIVVVGTRQKRLKTASLPTPKTLKK